MTQTVSATRIVIALRQDSPAPSRFVIRVKARYSVTRRGIDKSLSLRTTNLLNPKTLVAKKKSVRRGWDAFLCVLWPWLEPRPKTKCG